MTTRVILAVGWIAFLLYAYPGQATWDTVESVLAARTGEYPDRLPPMIAALWWCVELVVAGTFGMLAIQSACLLGGMYLVLRRSLSERAAAIAASCILVFPPVLQTMAFVWGENLMAGFTMLGIGCLLSPRRGVRVAGLAALLLASCVRYDAWAATLPVIVLLFRWSTLAGVRRYALAFGVWLAVTLLAAGANRVLVDRPSHAWHHTVALHDITGTLDGIERDLPDAELRAQLAGTELVVDHEIHTAIRASYRARDVASLLPQIWKAPAFGEVMPAARRDAIEAARDRLVSEHRGAYVRHRVAVLKQTLWLGAKRTGLGFESRDFVEQDLMRILGLPTGWTDAQHAVSDAIAAIARYTPLFVPWVYVALALLLLPFARRHRDVTALLASGMCLFGPFAIAASSRDARFTHWIVITVCVALVIVIARRRRGEVFAEPELASPPPLRAWLRELPPRATARVAALSPRAILALGLAGIALYSYPGFMSYDSVFQLLEARAGTYSDGHPPAMALLWGVVDAIVAGPVGMLVIQNVAFLAGAFLILRRRLSPRRAAIVAVALLWFPPVAAVMGVIWKDSMMAGLLMLGTGLLLEERRRTRLVGLAVLSLATAMRHNALAMTLPPVVLLFTWDPTHRWWKRYAIAIVAWVAITAVAQLGSRALADRQTYIWHQSLALLDMAGTLRHADPMPDHELRETLAGTPLRTTEQIQAATQHAFDPSQSYSDQLWVVTRAMFGAPATEDERAAVARAWRAIVFGNPGAYLAYRWHVFLQLVQLTSVPTGDPIYRYFTDVQDVEHSVIKTKHNAVPSGIQGVLRDLMSWIGDTPVFAVYLYLFAALLLLPFVVRDRLAGAILLSALASEALLFFLTPTTDLRYSFWLMTATVLAVLLRLARRIAGGT